MLMDVGIDVDLDGAQPLGREDHTVNSERLRVLPFAERSQYDLWHWYRPVTVLRLAGGQPHVSPRISPILIPVRLATSTTR